MAPCVGNIQCLVIRINIDIDSTNERDLTTANNEEFKDNKIFTVSNVIVESQTACSDNSQLLLSNFI